MSKELFTPQFPTFPVNNQFGQTIVQFGSTKIENAVIQIASSLVSNAESYKDGNLLPETIADESYRIAVACFEKCHEEFLKLSVTGEGSKIITECPPSKL